MKNSFRAFLMVLFVLMSSVGFSAGEDETVLLERFGNVLEELGKELKIPGLSAAVVKDQKVWWTRGFGYADRENKIKAAPGTAYFLASLTKTFASTILLQLVEQGKLDLDTSVSEFGIRIRSPGVITVRHLFSHTSEGQPGTFYRYNGYRFAYLRRVIEKVSGRSFKELLMENIVKPLGMTGTAPGIIKGESAYTGVYEKMTRSYKLDGEGRVVKGRSREKFGVSAGLISTVQDMAKYDIALDQHRFLRPETQELAFTPSVSPKGDVLPYGLGWFTQEYNGLRLVWHYGYNPFCGSTLILKVLGKHMTFILFANTDYLSRPFSLGAGDVLNSPAAVVFLRMFVFDAALPDVDWKNGTLEEMTAQLKEVEDTASLELYKRELTAYWRLYNAMGQKDAASRLSEVYSRVFPGAMLLRRSSGPVVRGQVWEPSVGLLTKVILAICSVIFLAGFISWPVGAVIGFARKRKSVGAISRIAVVIAWVDALICLLYVYVLVGRGRLEFLAAHGIPFNLSFGENLVAMIPFAAACFSVVLIFFTIFIWKKGTRPRLGRWFYMVFAAASVGFVLLCHHLYFIRFPF